MHHPSTHPHPHPHPHTHHNHHLQKPLPRQWRQKLQHSGRPHKDLNVVALLLRHVPGTSGRVLSCCYCCPAGAGTGLNAQVLARGAQDRCTSWQEKGQLHFQGSCLYPAAAAAAAAGNDEKTVLGEVDVENVRVRCPWLRTCGGWVGLGEAVSLWSG